MAWRIARSLQMAFVAFDTRFPNRDRRTDGAYGDPAHQTSRSGHNPDDTPGSLPESEDDDNEPEVRAIDVDADLNEPGATMWDVVQAILATPADRDRLLYIIHQRRIWSKSQGWRERSYTGSNPHTSHVHLSGDPAYDEDIRPWESILYFGLMEGHMFTIKGSNGLYLVTGEVDITTGTPIAVPITQTAFADYQAAKVRHVDVNYVNPSFYSIQSPPLAGDVDPVRVATEVVKRLPANGSLSPAVVDALRKLGQAADAVVAAASGSAS